NGLPISVLPISQFEQDVIWTRKIGYELLELVKSTPAFLLYKARHVRIDRIALLKLSTGLRGDRWHQLLKREAMAMFGLDHPNIPRLDDHDESYDRTYLICEFIDGGLTLSEVLHDGAQSRPLEPRRAAELAIRLAIGVQAIHEHGFLHLALNPD